MIAAAGLGALAAHYAWALWLAAPALGIAVVSLVVWWVSRPARPVTTPASIRGHRAYLDALATPPRERTAPPAPAAATEGPPAGGEADAVGAGRHPLVAVVRTGPQGTAPRGDAPDPGDREDPADPRDGDLDDPGGPAAVVTVRA